MTPSKEASKSVTVTGEHRRQAQSIIDGTLHDAHESLAVLAELLATREALKLARWERHYGPERYAVEYLLKGETEWRRTMDQPIESLPLQERVLWKNPAMAGTRMVAYCDSTRLLRDDELAQLAQTEGE